MPESLGKPGSEGRGHPGSAGGWVSSSCLQAQRGFFPVKELRFLVEIQRVRSSGGDPGCAGAWGFDQRERERERGKKSPETFHGKRALPTEHGFSQWSGSGTSKNQLWPPVHTRAGPAGPQQMPLVPTWGGNIEFRGSASLLPN